MGNVTSDAVLQSCRAVSTDALRVFETSDEDCVGLGAEKIAQPGPSSARSFNAVKPDLAAEIFQAIDEDEDGFLNMAELNNLKSLLGVALMSPGDYAAGCQHYGADPSRGWTLEQFRTDLGGEIATIHNRVFGDNLDMLQFVFESFDANEDNHLSLDEINSLKDILGMPALTEERFKCACAKYGADPGTGWSLEHLGQDLGANLRFVHAALKAKTNRDEGSTVGRGTSTSDKDLSSHRGSINDLSVSVSGPAEIRRYPSHHSREGVEEDFEALSALDCPSPPSRKSGKGLSTDIDKAEIQSAPDLLGSRRLSKGQEKGQGKGKCKGTKGRPSIRKVAGNGNGQEELPSIDEAQES